MLKILDKYILKSYIPLLLMTFLICWFIVLMQFLWKYVDELVGKGLSMWVIGQTVFYAAMSLVPLALPLGILLASLMFFGQIGERLELLAMKASGLPLYRIMAPLFGTTLVLALGLFYFQNTYMITSQVKMWTLLYSARYATPELEIPEGIFYNGIPGYNIYVGKRDQIHAGRMHDIMIYDHKAGNEKTRIIRADSGRIVMDTSKTYLTWKLYKGQSFENMSSPYSPLDKTPTSYAKERFGYKEIVILFDANFKMHSEEDMGSRFVGKNLSQLNSAIDTATRTIDSLRGINSEQLMAINESNIYSYGLPSRLDTTKTAKETRAQIMAYRTDSTHIVLDSVLRRSNLNDSLNLYRTAHAYLQQIRNESESRLYIDKQAFFDYRTNRQEWHRKFTFPVACLVFFFIGAPLGAIIRKGGIGVPIIASVLFFIVYYIIDTFGHNMISSEQMGIIMGMWISTFVLLPVGAYLTWQATRDSASLNLEAYTVFFRKLLGTARVRKIEIREIILEDIDYDDVLTRISTLKSEVEALLQEPWLKKAWLASRLILTKLVYAPSEERMQQVFLHLEDLISTLRNSHERMVLAKLQDMPVLIRRIVPLSIAEPVLKIENKIIQYIINIIFPLSLIPLWVLSTRRRTYVRDLSNVLRLLGELEEELNKNR